MATTGTRRTPAQTFALVFGVVYLLAGVLGFFAADSFTGGSADDKLIVFPVNHLHNIVHILIGGVLIAGSRTSTAAKSANLAMGIALLLVAALGFMGLDFMQDLLNVRGSGSPDNWLHLVTGLLAVYFGTAGAGGAARATT